MRIYNIRTTCKGLYKIGTLCKGIKCVGGSVGTPLPTSVGIMGNKNVTFLPVYYAFKKYRLLSHLGNSEGRGGENVAHMTAAELEYLVPNLIKLN